MAADDIKRSGRATQGVIVMRLREGEIVSGLAPVVGSDEDDDDASVEDVSEGGAAIVTDASQLEPADDELDSEDGLTDEEADLDADDPDDDADLDDVDDADDDADDDT
jgi:DNA gyrase C-terminal domain, beta-propeller